jgi:hypothetical protein
MRIAMLRQAMLVAIVVSIPAVAAGQDTCLSTTSGKGYPAWLNCRIERVLAASAGPGGDDKQAEIPSVSDDSSTLIDNSSTSDFIGVGMSLVGVRDRDDGQTTSGTTSVTVTGYSLLAAAHGRDPLRNADFYYSHANWRRVALTLGRQPQREDGKGLNAEAAIAGLKVVFMNLREISRNENVADIEALVGGVAMSTAAINTAVAELLASELGAGVSLATFVTGQLSLTNYAPTLMKITPALSERIDAVIAARIAADVALRDAIREKVAEIKRRPQASLAWSSTLRDTKAPDQHRLQVIVDYGMAPRLSFTANAGWDLVDAKGLQLDPTVDTNVGRVAAALQLALADTGPFGLRAAPKMSVAADVQWKRAERTWKAQWKFDLPVSAGVTVPVSFTWADRPERIDEKEVRGTVGFTIDTAKLAAALRL